MSWLTQDEYQRTIDQHHAEVQRALLVPTFEFYTRMWEFYSTEGKDPQLLHPVVDATVYEFAAAKVPVLHQRDGFAADGVIPIIFLEDISPDMADMFLNRVTDEELAHRGLRQEPHGFWTAILKLPFEHKRFTRYRRLVTELDVTTDVRRGAEWIAPLLHPFQTYLTSKGETPYVRPWWTPEDLLNQFRGDGYDQFTFVRVRQQAGEGVGVFTHPTPTQWGWTMTLHDGQSHIGNNVLLAAAQLAHDAGATVIDLGIGFYPWKATWTLERAYCRGLRYV